MTELWATGSRAFCQLDLSPIEEADDHACQDEDDLTFYTKILECNGIRAHTLRASQYRVHVQILRSGKYLTAGHQDAVLEMIEAAACGREEWAKNSGRYDRYNDLINHHIRAIVRGGLFAMSGTGKIVDLSGSQSQIENTPFGISGIPLETTISLPGIERSQIVAGATHFAALCDGSLYTWGDPRYPAPLGRMDPENRPPDAPNTSVPGLVHDLENLEDDEKVVKIAAGGYLTAALTKGGDCYVWGSQELGWSGSPEPLDFRVVDVAVGEQLVVLIVERDDGGREVWARGKSRHGELGLGKGTGEVKEWTKIPLDVAEDAELLQVVAGANCVLLQVRRRVLSDHS